MGNYLANSDGQVQDSGNMYEQILNGFTSWADMKFHLLGEWLKINVIDLAGVITILIIISISLKMLLWSKDEKDIKIIYTTIVCYTITKLFWRVVLHA
jgi:hypothetical protein